ncbi:hypothetical protein OAX78_00635 [Planctomycetota bacterium]|nr:hypothetical protein [Planctomycetota bacterium]
MPNPLSYTIQGKSFRYLSRLNQEHGLKPDPTCDENSVVAASEFELESRLTKPARNYCKTRATLWLGRTRTDRHRAGFYATVAAHKESSFSRSGPAELAVDRELKESTQKNVFLALGPTRVRLILRFEHRSLINLSGHQNDATQDVKLTIQHHCKGRARAQFAESTPGYRVYIEQDLRLWDDTLTFEGLATLTPEAFLSERRLELARGPQRALVRVKVRSPQNKTWVKTVIDHSSPDLSFFDEWEHED